eukprot:Blabericola_migrator_1__1978@NODE_153_length_12753_cov_114_743891_g134_i0_p7_GENE_NODE_153_length_12753_cov_114_743891_g134_i0NODE_153_length_12753_cov_114_743891_g134_i0_p7_ORF_typecomplete_len112_score7_83Methyltransf_32/PF13679_6/0_44_NODE_153_length_12753_cov_114_743891_g134_i087429077
MASLLKRSATRFSLLPSLLTALVVPVPLDLTLEADLMFSYTISISIDWAAASSCEPPAPLSTAMFSSIAAKTIVGSYGTCETGAAKMLLHLVFNASAFIVCLFGCCILSTI